MYPAYMWAYSYPHHTNSMHYARNDDPRTKDITPHMKVDHSVMNTPYQQPMPYSANYPYPVPHEYHGCCNHGCYGGDPYSFQPPYTHDPPPPPPFNAHGCYPPFAGAYHGYCIPPPHHSVVQPRYDYDKNHNANHHCCGCHYKGGEKNSRIERVEPEVGKKATDSVPVWLKDSPYPVMWVPPGYMKTEPKVTEKEKNTCDPVSLNLLEPSKRIGNGERSKDQHDEDVNCFPFPVLWLPSKNNETGNKVKENNLDLVAHKDLPHETKRQTRKNDEGSGSEAESETSTKHAVQKVIPVKQLETNDGKKSKKVIEMKAKSDPVEKVNVGTEKSTSKTSKLPPVCLRIDPVPRKKNSSRSPSPSADKQRSNRSVTLSPVDNSKSAQQQTQLSEDLKMINKEEQLKGNIKNIKVTDDVNKVEKNTVADPCENARRGEQNESGKGMVCKGVKKKNLSEHEAALIIQCAYRGFEVRKSQPLTKLRQITEVKDQVVDLNNRIQDLGLPSSGICIDDKQKLIIGEKIMSLLLKLDTIQGLHPIIRDVRKSLAKELMGLQEKLDSLTFVKSETPSGEIMSSTGHDTNIEESSSGLCVNYEPEATESQKYDGDAEDANTEPHVELQNERSTKGLNHKQLQVSVEHKQPVDDDAIKDEFDRVKVQPDSSEDNAVELYIGVLKDQEVENTSSVNESPDIKLDRLVENSTPDLKDNQLQILMETQSPVDIVGTNIEVVESNDGAAKVSDVNFEAQVESESQHGTVEVTNNQLEMSETEQPVGQEVTDQSQALSDNNMEAGEVENCEVEDANSVHEDHDINPEKPVEQETKELINNQIQMAVETEWPVDNGIQKISDQADSANSIEFSEVRDINIESQVESRIEMSEIEQPVPEEKSDQMQFQLESDVENVKSCEHPQVEIKEFQDDAYSKTREEEFDNEPIKFLDDTMVEDKLPKEDTINGVQEDIVVSTEEAPKVDDFDSCTKGLIEDLGGAPPILPTGSLASSFGDRKLIEENEKLRVAVEELLKAGNKQLGVIRELTGKVKHLEKKLSKKKKIKVNKCRSRGGSVVDDELRSCIV